MNCSDDVFFIIPMYLLLPVEFLAAAGEKYIRVSLCATEEKIDEAIKRIKNLTE